MHYHHIMTTWCLLTAITAVVLCALSTPEAGAVPLDKLAGGGVIVAGGVTFSNFRAPSFVGIGPGAVDVQGSVVTDATGAQIGAGLLFTPVVISPHVEQKIFCT